MTRFETLDGQQLGARFCGDNGATFHITSHELRTLFSLDEDTQLTSDNAFFGTAGDLLDMWNAGHKATAEEMMRRFKHEDGNTTLHFKSETRIFLDKFGNLTRKTKFSR
jgi:hypothetical protein